MYLRDPDAVPEFVPAMGLRLALERASKLDAVDAAVDALGAEAKIAWEYAVNIKRTHPLVVAAAQQSGITESELDGYFREALAASPE